MIAGMVDYAGIESDEAVRKRFRATIAIVVAAIALGAGLDIVHWHVGSAPWIARSGAIVVVCGTYLAFRSASVLITLTDDKLLRTNPTPSFRYGRLAFFLIAGGTLLWCFGDLIRLF
jgi:hypothetical protein